MTTQVLAEILVKCGVVQHYKTNEQNATMLGRIAEAAVMVSAREADWQKHAEQSDKELCELQDALGCPAELRLVECARCDWHGTTRDASLPGECPKPDCTGRLIDGGVADAQVAAMERIRDLIAMEVSAELRHYEH